ncbi:MAG: hypothetical protein U1E23_09345 [Reyranellaceae bacterium]
MSERLSPIERLARRICWLEFSRRPEGKTEAAYWRGVHPDKKREYIEDARWLVWMSHRLFDTKGSRAVRRDAEAAIARKKRT